MQRGDITVSVILPALLPDSYFIRCLSSIRAALTDEAEYEIICVVTNKTAFADFEEADITIRQDDGTGIYNAMNLGLTLATGTYVYFIGQDDILLPAAADALNQGKEHHADLIVADVFWGRHSIFRNYPFRHSLVWRNWCHQGLFYHRLRFMDKVGRFPAQFTAQADHYTNIVLTHTPGLRTYRYRDCIAWYASGGFSSQHPDTVFRDRFPGLILENFGLASYLMVVFRRALLSSARSIRRVLG